MTPQVAIFEGLISYLNDKGAESVDSNNIQFKNFILWDHYSVSLETKTLKYNQDINSYEKSFFYNENLGPILKDSIIIGNSKSDDTKSVTTSGLVIAWDRGQLISNISFFNFPSEKSHTIRATEILGRCDYLCGGWTNKFKQLYFDNVQKRTKHRWDWDFIADDLDGSLTNTLTGGVVVFNGDLIKSNPNCINSTLFENGVVCPKKSWIRVAYTPVGSEATTYITNSLNQTTFSPFLCARLTQQGSMFSLESNQTYTITHYDPLLTYATDLEYNSVVYGLKPSEYLIFEHPLSGSKPDRIYLINGLISNESTLPLMPNNNKNGDWYWNNLTNTLSVIIINDLKMEPFVDYNLWFSAESCFGASCAGKPNYKISNQVTLNDRPENVLFWSQLSTWRSIATSEWGNPNRLPIDNDQILIPAGVFVVVDCVLPKLKYLQIDGYLEFEDGRDQYLEVEMILINGGQFIIGWENAPITSEVKIVVKGELRTLNINNLPQGFDKIKGKGIGVLIRLILVFNFNFVIN